jgi:UDP-N-acetylmuramoyl-tripeptide--D-alanyl-D-alanine ligase
MPLFSPKFLASATGGAWTRPPAVDRPVSAFAVDTRRLSPGDCFVALKTPRRDGHDYLEAARAAGAAAALVSAPRPEVDLPQLVVTSPLAAFQAIAAAHRQAFPGQVIGVTGSAGKTSTKELLALLLSAAPGDVLATSGNLNNHLGVPLTLTRLDSSVHKFAVIEAGIGGRGEMALLADMIRPNHAIVTLIGPAHLATIGTLADVAREKSLLPAAVPAGGLRVFGVGCLNYHEFRSFPSPGTVAAPGIVHSGAETRITIAPNLHGTLKPEELTFVCRRVSEGMAHNAAIALTTALWLGVDVEEARQRLALWQPAALRGEQVHDHAGRWVYVDCYNANPASMLDALEAFVSMSPADQPRLFLIGGMEELGTAALEYHQRLGEALNHLLRPEDSALILADPELARAVSKAAFRRSVQPADNLAALRARLEAHAGSVFIKGSRRYQLESLLLPNVSVAETPGVGH